MKLGMQQLFKALTAATNPGVMEFDFECLKFWKEWGHEMCVLCALTMWLFRADAPTGRTCAD